MKRTPMGFDLLAWRTIVLLLAASFAWSMAGLSEAFADWDEPADLPGMEDTSHDTTVIVLATLVVAVAVFWWVKKSGKDDQEEKSDKGSESAPAGSGSSSSVNFTNLETRILGGRPLQLGAVTTLQLDPVMYTPKDRAFGGPHNGVSTGESLRLLRRASAQSQ